MYKSIDLFAGIGGIRKGFDNAFGNQIETVFVSEWDKFAQDTYKKNFHDPDNYDGVISHLEPGILECEVKWALGTKLVEVMEFQLSYFKS